MCHCIKACKLSILHAHTSAKTEFCCRCFRTHPFYNEHYAGFEPRRVLGLLEKTSVWSPIKGCATSCSLHAKGLWYLVKESISGCWTSPTPHKYRKVWGWVSQDLIQEKKKYRGKKSIKFFSFGRATNETSFPFLQLD